MIRRGEIWSKATNDKDKISKFLAENAELERYRGGDFYGGNKFCVINLATDDIYENFCKLKQENADENWKFKIIQTVEKCDEIDLLRLIEENLDIFSENGTSQLIYDGKLLVLKATELEKLFSKINESIENVFDKVVVVRPTKNGRYRFAKDDFNEAWLIDPSFEFGYKFRVWSSDSVKISPNSLDDLRMYPGTFEQRDDFDNDKYLYSMVLSKVDFVETFIENSCIPRETINSEVKEMLLHTHKENNHIPHLKIFLDKLIDTVL